MINIIAEINKYENKKSIKKINKTKSYFFETINKINTTLAQLTKKKKREGKNY